MEKEKNFFLYICICLMLTFKLIVNFIIFAFVCVVWYMSEFNTIVYYIIIFTMINCIMDSVNYHNYLNTGYKKCKKK